MMTAKCAIFHLVTADIMPNRADDRNDLWRLARSEVALGSSVVSRLVVTGSCPLGGAWI